jgi:hypothetical protein
LRSNQLETLLEVMKDKSYKFDKRYVFRLISEKIVGVNKSTTGDDGNIFANIILYDLYEPYLSRIILWYVGSFGYDDTFM